MAFRCQHLDQIHDVSPNTPEGCEECLAVGDEWVHLRMCLLQSFQPGESWRYCYADEALV